jgi:hypothetical protein
MPLITFFGGYGATNLRLGGRTRDSRLYRHKNRPTTAWHSLNMRLGSRRLSHFFSEMVESTKDVVKASELKHEQGLILDPDQPKVLWVAAKDLVAGYQSPQPMAVDKGHIFEINHDALDASLG